MIDFIREYTKINAFMTYKKNVIRYFTNALVFFLPKINRYKIFNRVEKYFAQWWFETSYNGHITNFIPYQLDIDLEFLQCFFIKQKVTATFTYDNNILEKYRK